MLVSQKCNKRSLDTWCRVIERDIRNKIRAAFVIWPIHSVREIKERQRSSACPRIRLCIKGAICRESIKNLIIKELIYKVHRVLVVIRHNDLTP